MWENPVSFQLRLVSPPKTHPRFVSFSCKKTGNYFGSSNSFLHRQSTGGNFPRKNPQTFLFHKQTFQEFPQARKSEYVLHKRRKFSKGFRVKFFTIPKTRKSSLPHVFRAFPKFRQALKPLLLKFFYSYSFKSAKTERLRFSAVESGDSPLTVARLSKFQYGSRDWSLALLLVLFLVSRKEQER